MWWQTAISAVGGFFSNLGSKQNEPVKTDNTKAITIAVAGSLLIIVAAFITILILKKKKIV